MRQIHLDGSPHRGAAVVLTIVCVLLLAVQVARLRRALHVFQLEGYKRARFLSWCVRNPVAALFVTRPADKKPLVMTERAKRIYSVSLGLSILLVALPALLVGIATDWFTGSWVGLIAAIVVSVGAPLVLIAADVALQPWQTRINQGFMTAATGKLQTINPTVIGVTGSFGKTSTKFAIEKMLAVAGATLATPGSFNTPLGVCRTINETMEEGCRYFVVEMGAYHEGEIAELCEFVHQDVGVLTAIGPAHLERFGSMEAIQRAKYEIVAMLPRDGIAVMNVDDPRVRALADGTSDKRVIRYGIDDVGRPDVTASGITVDATGTSFALHAGGASIVVTTKLLGRHAIGHILAGASVATALGVALNDLAPVIAALEPVEHRLQIIPSPGGVTVIDDAYNSNPSGASAALEVLAQMAAGKRVVVTPGIIELGPLQPEANETFGREASQIADTVIFVARVNRDALVRGARSASRPAEVIVVDSLAEATERLGSLLSPGDVILFENDLPDQLEGRAS